MDSREVNVKDVVNNVEVQLSINPVKSFLMDIIIVDCLPKWGMLSKTWETSIGGSIQMDLSYTTIPMHGVNVKLHREQKILDNVERRYKTTNIRLCEGKAMWHTNWGFLSQKNTFSLPGFLLEEGGKMT